MKEFSIYLTNLIQMRNERIRIRNSNKEFANYLNNQLQLRNRRKSEYALTKLHNFTFEDVWDRMRRRDREMNDLDSYRPFDRKPLEKNNLREQLNVLKKERTDRILREQEFAAFDRTLLDFPPFDPAPAMPTNTRRTVNFKFLSYY